MRCHVLALSLLIATLGFAGGRSAVRESSADWPQFRGPHRDDVSPDKGLLEEWPRGGPRLVWKATGVGGGYSSVAVAGGRVFTLGNKGDTTYAFAVSRKDGRPLWSARVGRADGNLGCTPTVDGDRVYAIGQDGDLVCLNAATGRELWRKNFKRDFKGNCGRWSYTESPLVDGDKLVCTPGSRDATMVALDKKTGRLIWKCAAPVDEPTAGYSSIVVSDAGGVRQYVQLLAGGVIGVAAKDGRFLWKYDKLGQNTANIPTPIAWDDYVFCSAGYEKGGALLKLEATDDGVKAEEVYYKHELKNKHGGLVRVGDYVYGDHDESGKPFCAEVKTGKIVWQRKGGGQGSGSASVAYADGRLYVHYQNGIVSLVNASPERYEEISSFKIPNAGGAPSWAHPVVVGGRLYLREQDTIWCYDVKQSQ